MACQAAVHPEEKELQAKHLADLTVLCAPRCVDTVGRQLLLQWAVDADGRREQIFVIGLVVVARLVVAAPPLLFLYILLTLPSPPLL